jgi:hypothetical protein
VNGERSAAPLFNRTCALHTITIANRHIQVESGCMRVDRDTELEPAHNHHLGEKNGQQDVREYKRKVKEALGR